MFWLRNKKDNFQLRTLIWGPVKCYTGFLVQISANRAFTGATMSDVRALPAHETLVLILQIGEKPLLTLCIRGGSKFFWKGGSYIYKCVGGFAFLVLSHSS